MGCPYNGGAVSVLRSLNPVIIFDQTVHIIRHLMTGGHVQGKMLQYLIFVTELRVMFQHPFETAFACDDWFWFWSRPGSSFAEDTSAALNQVRVFPEDTYQVDI